MGRSTSIGISAGSSGRPDRGHRRGRAVLSALLLAITTFAVTACQDEGEAATVDRIWFDAATTDEQNWELMRRIRQVDPCALVPRTALEEHGVVREVRVGSAMIAACRAVVTDAATDLEISWTLARAPGGSAAEEDRRVGEVVVEVLDPGTSDSAGDEVNACWVTAQFPSMTQILLTVKAPPAVDTCGIGNTLIDTAIAQLPTSPPYGSSPDTARSVLTGADPCEILPEIGAEPSLPVVENQLVQSCRIGEGLAATIGYEYQDAGEIFHDEITAIGGRQVFVIRFEESEQVGYSFVVGPPVAANMVPVISVFGSDQSLVERTRDALLRKYPAA